MIRLNADEAWEEIASAQTGILTTLRRDGMPIALPVWFVAEDRTIAMRTPAGTKKIARVRHDPRASFLVESGERWVELRAVHLTGTCRDSSPTSTAIEPHRGGHRREVRGVSPAAGGSARGDAATYYANAGVFCGSCPRAEILTWDNARPHRGTAVVTLTLPNRLL